MQNNHNLTVTASPHIAKNESVKGIMYKVIIALIPSVIASYIFFGARAIVIISISVVSAVLLEMLIQFLRHKPVTVTDGSAIITGMLLAFNLPVSVPFWIPVLGASVAVIVAKHAFGGLGYNIFNPALVGRAFLLTAYPVHMTRWSVDAATCATPLAIAKEKIAETLPSYYNMFVGNRLGCIGETSILALLIGALFLFSCRTITWHIPLTYIGTVAFSVLLLGRDPVFHIMAGGLVLGALFMATDMVTSPVTPKGMIIFGFGCGVLTTLIRIFGSYPEGVSYSILFMNACTPLIERYCLPRPFGARGKKAVAAGF